MSRTNRLLFKPIKIDPNPDIEEQIGFPEESPFYGNVVIYQLNLRPQNNEIWISNLGAQTHQPEQELTPLIIIAPPYIHIPPHGPDSGA